MISWSPLDVIVFVWFAQIYSAIDRYMYSSIEPLLFDLLFRSVISPQPCLTGTQMLDFASIRQSATLSSMSRWRCSPYIAIFCNTNTTQGLLTLVCKGQTTSKYSCCSLGSAFAWYMGDSEIVSKYFTDTFTFMQQHFSCIISHRFSIWECVLTLYFVWLPLLRHFLFNA